MLSVLAKFASGIRADPKRTLELVSADYSVMTELADTLLREAGVPFRVGHKVASDLAAYGRSNQKRPIDLSFSEVAEVYKQVTQQAIPLTPEQVQQAMSAEHFVRSRRGTGGPQPSEMKRMLDGHRSRLADLRKWGASEQTRLRTSNERLEAAFSKLL